MDIREPFHLWKIKAEFWDVGRAEEPWSEPAMPEELGNGETACGKTFCFQSFKNLGTEGGAGGREHHGHDSAGFLGR